MHRCLLFLARNFRWVVIRPMFMPGLKAFLKMSEFAFFGSGSAGLGISADAIAWARGSIRQKEDSRTATLPLRRRNRMVSASSRRGIGIFVAGSATVPDCGGLTLVPLEDRSASAEEPARRIPRCMVLASYCCPATRVPPVPLVPVHTVLASRASL